MSNRSPLQSRLPRYRSNQAHHALWPASRIALHALSLGFEHPATGKPLVFESQWPSEMRRFIGE